MRYNVISKSQKVQILVGKYKGRVGHVLKLYLLIDLKGAIHMCAVRLPRSIGIRNFPLYDVEVVK